MVKIEGLFEELVDMGHTERWARKKVSLTEIDNEIEEIENSTDKLLNSGKAFSLISAELDRLQEEHDKKCEERDEVYSELCKLEDSNG